MPDIGVDAGPLIALFKRSDRYHAAAKAFLARSERATLVTNLLVIGEVAAMLSPRHGDLVAGLSWLIDNIEIDADAGADLPRCIEIVEEYRDLPADLADASLVALCERRGMTLVASVDRDFDVYRLPRGRRLRNVFFEAEAP